MTSTTQETRGKTQETLAVLEHARSQSTKTGECLQLSNHDFSGANLTNQDLTDAILKGTVLAGTTLKGAKLYGADLTSCDISRADLSSADLRGATFDGVTGNAKLDGALVTAGQYSKYKDSLFSRYKLKKEDAIQNAYRLVAPSLEDTTVQKGREIKTYPYRVAIDGDFTDNSFLESGNIPNGASAIAPFIDVNDRTVAIAEKASWTIDLKFKPEYLGLELNDQNVQITGPARVTLRDMIPFKKGNITVTPKLIIPGKDSNLEFWILADSDRPQFTNPLSQFLSKRLGRILEPINHKTGANISVTE